MITYSYEFICMSATNKSQLTCYTLILTNFYGFSVSKVSLINGFYLKHKWKDQFLLKYLFPCKHKNTFRESPLQSVKFLIFFCKTVSKRIFQRRIVVLLNCLGLKQQTQCFMQYVVIRLSTCSLHFTVLECIIFSKRVSIRRPELQRERSGICIVSVKHYFWLVQAN